MIDNFMNDFADEVNSIAMRACGFAESYLMECFFLVSPSSFHLLHTSTPVANYLLSYLGLNGRLCQYFTSEQIGIGDSGVPGIYYHQGVRQIYGDVPTKYRTTISRQLLKLRESSMIKTISIKGKGFLCIQNYYKMMNGVDPKAWQLQRKTMFYRLQEATAWIDKLENFEIGFKSIGTDGYDKIVSVFKRAGAIIKRDM